MAKSIAEQATKFMFEQDNKLFEEKDPKNLINLFISDLVGSINYDDWYDDNWDELVKTFGQDLIDDDYDKVVEYVSKIKAEIEKTLKKEVPKIVKKIIK